MGEVDGQRKAAAAVALAKRGAGVPAICCAAVVAVRFLYNGGGGISGKGCAAVGARKARQ